jgi:hypothetical protein
VRAAGLAAALSAFRPGVPAAWLATQLGFESGKQLAEWALGTGSAVLLPDAPEPMLCAAVRAQPAVAPGQAVVCFEGDRVLCGGWIS